MNGFHFDSLLVGLYTLRTNPMRTVLSTLGVIIGVAALVAVLSLGDSLEAFSRQQIEKTTDLQSVSLTPRTVDIVNGILIPRKNAASLTADDVVEIQQLIDGHGIATVTLTRSRWISVLPDSTERAVLMTATLPGALEMGDNVTVTAGRFLEWDDFDSETPVAVLSHEAAALLETDPHASSLVGRVLSTGEQIVGIISPRERQQAPTVLLPFDARNRARLADDELPPIIILRGHVLEDVPIIVERLEEWISSQEAAGPDDFTISSSNARVSQASQAMMVFKLALGSIAGISLLVGGIGIMNILLASVTERTREIGIRRATGARKRHILIQFLSESIVISVVGSFIGATIGVLSTVAITSVIGIVTEAPLSASFSAGSLLFSAVAAILIGLAFGTYPARRAARIEPAVAMRYE